MLLDGIGWGMVRFLGVSGCFKPCGRNLADRADVVGEGNPHHVEFGRVRVAPHVFAWSHDNLTAAIREEVLGWFGRQRCWATRTDKPDSRSLDHFFFLHGLMFKP